MNDQFSGLRQPPAEPPVHDVAMPDWLAVTLVLMIALPILCNVIAFYVGLVRAIFGMLARLGNCQPHYRPAGGLPPAPANIRDFA